MDSIGSSTGRGKIRVHLTLEQRERLEEVVRNGHSPAKKITQARVLLMADETHPQGRYHDEQIGEILGLHRNSVRRIRIRFVEQGEQPALDRKQRVTPPIPPKLDGAAEAQLVAICCSPAPQGRVRWTLSLLRNEMIGRKIVTSVCLETIRKALKKTSCGPGGWNASASRTRTRHASWLRWNRSSKSTRSPRTRMSR